MRVQHETCPNCGDSLLPMEAIKIITLSSAAPNPTLVISVLAMLSTLPVWSVEPLMCLSIY